MMKRLLVIFWMVIVCLPGVVRGESFETALAKAFINISPDASNASMGNTWVATPLFGSDSAAVTAMGTYDVGGVSFNYGVIDFAKGPDAQFYSPSVLVKLPVGILQLSYAAGDSGRRIIWQEFSEEGNFSEEIEFDSIEEIDLQYGLQFAEKIFFQEDKLYAGFGYTRGKSEIFFGSRFNAPMESSTALLNNETKSRTWNVGATYQPNSLVTVGAFYAHSWDKTTDTLDFDGWVEKDTVREQSNQYRFGIGWQVTPSTFLAADYQHLDLPSGNADQLFVGIEQAVYQDAVYIYAGWADDGPTGGVGVYLPAGGINLAYMHDTNDGLGETLGKTRIVMVSAYLNF